MWIGLLVLLLSSSSLASQPKFPAFNIESEGEFSRKFVPVNEVISELQRISPKFEDTYLKNALESVMATWNQLEQRCICQIPDFRALNEEERKPFFTREEYYVTKCLLTFSQRAFFYVAFCLQELVFERTTFSVKLLDYFAAQKPAVIAEVAFNFLMSGVDDVFKDFLFRYPQLVDWPVADLDRELTFTFLGAALKYKKIELASFLIQEMKANVNAGVELLPGYRASVFFLTIHPDDLAFSIQAANLFFDNENFSLENCHDQQGLSPVSYSVHNCPVTFADYLVQKFGFRNMPDSSDPLKDAFAFSLIIGRLDWSLKLRQFGEHFNAAARNSYGDTYLMLAARYNRAFMVASLLQIGQAEGLDELKPGFYALDGKNALLDAINFRSYKALQVLVDAASEQEINDSSVYNPLALAVFLQDDTSIRIILKHPKLSEEAFLNFHTKISQ